MKTKAVWVGVLILAVVYGIVYFFPKYAMLVFLVVAITWLANSWRKKRGVQ